MTEYRKAIIETLISPDEDLLVSHKPIIKHKLPFRFNMTGTKCKRDEDSMDIFKVLQKVSGTASQLFFKFADERNAETNHVSYIPSDRAEAAKSSRAYKELHKLKLVVRVRQGVYLVNPYAVVPKVDKFEDVKKEWLVLINK